MGGGCLWLLGVYYIGIVLIGPELQKALEVSIEVAYFLAFIIITCFFVVLINVLDASGIRP